MMLNPFPIQFLAMLAYMILRLFIGGILLYLASTHYWHRDELSEKIKLPAIGSMTTVVLLVLSEISAGTILILGAFTQYGALLVMLLCALFLCFTHSQLHPSIPPKLFWVLLLGASISVFITGAGAIAFDLPI